MGETANIAEIAKRVLHEIFRVFYWELRPLEDTNFDCVSQDHLTPKGEKKATHPTDVIFHYHDPYLNKVVYLHTDLKSYSKTSLKIGKIRDALKSLAQTLACAHVSSSWKSKYPKDDEVYEVRGLLFVVNHDNKAVNAFDDYLKKISKNSLDVEREQVIHVLSPRDITNLYSIATDIQLSIQRRELSPRYRFFYPDLTLWKRKVADDVRTAATIETLRSPYFILRHEAVPATSESPALQGGSVVYYSRKGETVDEFIYLLDSLLRYQLVKANEAIKIKIFNPDRAGNFKSNFDRAKAAYCKSWGFENTREEEIMCIAIDSIAQICPNYSPDEIGWRV